MILVWPLVGLALLASLWAITHLQLNVERAVAQKHALASAASLSRAYAQSLVRTLEQMDQMTMELKYDWEHSKATLSLEESRRNGLYTAPQFAMVAILDRKGRPVTATVPFERLPSGSAEYVLKHWRSNASALRIGVGRSPAAAAPLINFTRRLEDRNGEFDGVVVVAVDPAYLSQFYDSFNFGQHGLTAMLSDDGEVFSARVGAAVLPVSRTPFIDTAFVEGESGVALSAGRSTFADRENRFVAWQALKAYPFTAVIGLAASEVLRPYEETRAIYMVIAGAVSGLLLLFTIIASVLSVRLAWRQHQSEGVRSAYRMATEGTSDGFYIVAAIRNHCGTIEDFELVDCNEPGAHFFGLRREQLLGLRLQARAQEPYFAELIGIYREAMETGCSDVEIELPESNPFNLRWIRRRLVRSGDRLAVTLQDISRSKSHEADLLRVANEDGLTGLPNRHWLGRFLPEALRQAGAANSMLALLFIDLDGFKAVNDTRGHAEGDAVLCAAALRLKSVLRPGDHVVRLGGDEFVVILDPVDSDARVARVAERVAAAVEEPFLLDGERHKMGASIGISVYPRDGADPATLLKNADIAMYAVKVAGKGHHRFYQPELFEVIRQRRDIEQNLVAALEEDQFTVYYQPRVDALTGEMCSMEALVRWIHPQQGMVPPLEFIPVAESSGLIAQLGARVIDMVCQQLAQWKSLGLELLPVSINVSAHQFGRGDVDRVLAVALARYGIEGRWIEVEITESAMMGDQNDALGQLAAIRSQGVRLLVDDFGTGYSSLSQLQKFAMDGLKIDRAFTLELGKSKQGEVFIRAILSMAHALGMSVVAEGVETVQQLEILRALQCNEVQGYLISRPVPAEQMLELMRKRFLIDLPEPVLASYCAIANIAK
ncbi:EAL domain-containing protein [Janthinobacterium fluminis]|uniref:EAL domain-containing protein n=1 Tax=Janthinobacterium fluminis TaxID=2987524 RepID=A0ABT5JV62_9BURK|nr:EAL domain-containing protein [Janthinobacterium fluminis]MDC8756609.1 EAL domain-containing protein [Janthinobacterium fluminis]